MYDRRIRDLAKQSAITALAAANVFPTRATQKVELLRLLNSLHPRFVRGGLIRLGPAGDGGYLVPDDLEGISACFSPGVGAVVGFEQDCVARGIHIFMADGSVDPPIVGDPCYSFIKKFVGAINSPVSTTMDEWVRLSLPDSRDDLMLQIDIEGFEYETFLNMSDSLLGRFRIIAAEFHGLDALWSGPFFGIAARAFEKILRSHSCVHIHPNNCARAVVRGGLSIPPVMEFTFLRHDRLQGATFAAEFPHPLDSDNTNAPHLKLPSCWFRAN